jgi:hypothetical protein
MACWPAGLLACWPRPGPARNAVTTPVIGMFIWLQIDDQRQRSLGMAGVQTPNTSGAVIGGGRQPSQRRL